MSTAPQALERLASLVQPDGGWGYQPGQASHVEPTCLALLALTADREKYAAAIEAGVRWVESNRNPDGSYRLTRGRPQAVWTTALVLFTRHALGHPAADVRPTADRLLAVSGRLVKMDQEVADMKMDIDLSLVGWPWAEANFSWVEPTAWACLALRAVGDGTHPRVQEGIRLLLDRSFDTGGANYGNRIVLGRTTEPIPGPTAIVLLALQGMTDQPRIDAAKGYLRVHAAKTTDLEHLAWAKLALTAHADDSTTRDFLPELDSRLAGSLSEEIHRTDGLGAGPYRLALAALALGTSTHCPFRLVAPSPLGGEGGGEGRSEGKHEGLARANGATGGAAPHPQPLSPGGRGEPASFGDRLKSKFRGWLVGGLGRIRPMPVTSAVHIARADTYDAPLFDILKSQFAHFRQHVPMAGKRVVLKPNLVEYHKGKVINTDVRVIDAVIRLCKEEGAAEVIVGEGPGHWRNVQYLVKECGLGEVLERHAVKFVDLNHDEPVKMLNLGRVTGLEYLYLARTVLNAEVFVSLPKMKTHHWAGVTLSLKNLFGTLPGICYGWPKNELHWRGIPGSIVDIACTHTPHLAIVDGIVGMEGDGPLNGTARPCGALVMGVDLVAVDATCCRLMKIPPQRIPALALAQMKRLGTLKQAAIPQLGEGIDALATAFELPPNIEAELIPEAEAAKIEA